MVWDDHHPNKYVVTFDDSMIVLHESYEKQPDGLISYYMNIISFSGGGGETLANISFASPNLAEAKKTAIKNTIAFIKNQQVRYASMMQSLAEQNLIDDRFET
jgi:hypothetical protein